MPEKERMTGDAVQDQVGSCVYVWVCVCACVLCKESPEQKQKRNHQKSAWSYTLTSIGAKYQSQIIYSQYLIHHNTNSVKGLCLFDNISSRHEKNATRVTLSHTACVFTSEKFYLALLLWCFSLRLIPAYPNRSESVCGFVSRFMTNQQIGFFSGTFHLLPLPVISRTYSSFGMCVLLYAGSS